MSTRTDLVPVERRLTGSPTAVRNMLATAKEHGLVVGKPKELGHTNQGQLVIQAIVLEKPERVLIEGLTPCKVPNRQRRVAVISAGVGSAMLAASVLVWAVVTVLAWIAANAAMLLGALFLVALAFGGLVKSGKCPGLHCPGCGD